MLARTMTIALVFSCATSLRATVTGAEQPIRVAGTLSTMEGRRLTVASADDNVTTTVVACDDTNKVTRDGEKSPATVGDRKPGMMVGVSHAKPDNLAKGIIAVATTPAPT